MVYASLLARRYLTSRVIPLIAVLAVALNVALVIIVVSVMSGFLDTLRSSGRTLMGDVVVSHEIVGIPDYEALIERIEAMPEAEAASPLIETFGLLRMPYGRDGEARVQPVQVWAIDPPSLTRVTGFERMVYWQPPGGDDGIAADDPRRNPDKDRLEEAMGINSGDGPSTLLPGMMLGIEISPFNRRLRDGSYRPQADEAWMPLHDATLSLVPVSAGGRISEPRERRFQIVNEFQSKVYQVDSQRVLIGLGEGQRMLRMAGGDLFDPRGELDEIGRPRVIGRSPSRATTILVKAAPGVTPSELSRKVSGAYRDFVEAAAADPATAVPPPPFVEVQTWEERLRDLIAPVEKERDLMNVLFSIVYLVSAGLVLSIFWAIVHEKTRDIGILRSVGASRLGVLWIFLRYGLVVGAIGAGFGLVLGWIVVDNINAIHDAMGDPAPRWSVVLAFGLAGAFLLGALLAIRRRSLLHALVWSIATAALAAIGVGLLLHKGALMWDPSVYYFDRIPSRIDLARAVTTMIGAVAFSVLGAAIPAAKAADTDPVRALRYE
jgi:lipoprotein-releasing system permease protein